MIPSTSSSLCGLGTAAVTSPRRVAQSPSGVSHALEWPLSPSAQEEGSGDRPLPLAAPTPRAGGVSPGPESCRAAESEGGQRFCGFNPKNLK